jgi:type VI secretion system secreted protein Hcp
MALDMFIKIEGIKGESKDKVFKGEIDVLSWGWGISQTGSFHHGGGGGTGKANFQDLSFTKWLDKSTPLLMLHCANGKHIPKAELFVRKAGENPLDYLVITMEKIIVGSYSTGGGHGEEKLTEHITLNFAKVKVEYQEQNDKGGKEGGKVPFTWDIEANSK